jgi:hypothetical protein
MAIKVRLVRSPAKAVPVRSVKPFWQRFLLD